MGRSSASFAPNWCHAVSGWGVVWLAEPAERAPRAECVTDLTGTPAQIAHAARADRVYYGMVTPTGAPAYLMDHASLFI